MIEINELKSEGGDKIVCPVMSGPSTSGNTDRDGKYASVSYIQQEECVKEDYAWWIREVVIDFKTLAKGVGLKDISQIENITIPEHCGEVDPQTPIDKQKMESVAKLIVELRKEQDLEA